MNATSRWEENVEFKMKLDPNDVSVIIPTWNEEASIAAVIAGIPVGLAREVIVVDGGSTDRTVEIARQSGARVILEPRRGYGRACASGVENALGEIVAFLDGDGSDDPSQMSELIHLITSGAVDLALGSRLAGKMESGAMPWHQRAGNWFCAGLINFLYGCRLTDLSPFRACRRNRLAGLDLGEMTYGYPTEMLVKAARKGWRLSEIPVGYRRRIGGRSKIGGTVKGSLLATWYILKVILRYARTTS